MDCTLPGSSVHVIFQARILEWVVISSFKGSSQSKDWTHISCCFWIADEFFISEPLGKPSKFTGLGFLVTHESQELKILKFKKNKKLKKKMFKISQFKPDVSTTEFSHFHLIYPIDTWIKHSPEQSYLISSRIRLCTDKLIFYLSHSSHSFVNCILSILIPLCVCFLHRILFLVSTMKC